MERERRLNKNDLLLNCENPFSTCRIRPGAIPFIFPADESLDTLLARLEQNGWWGEIVGPHGSGKSTLLAALLPAVEKLGRIVVCFKLHDRLRRLPPLPAWPRETPLVIAVDGFEQAGPWYRFWLKHGCRRRGWGLVAASHRSFGFPLLYRTAVTVELAQAIVGRLMSGRREEISSAEIAEAFARSQGNLREMLFELYDLYEQRRLV